MFKKYICPGCEKEFATRQSLWNHKQRCLGKSAPRKRTFNDSYNVPAKSPPIYNVTPAAVKRPIGSSKAPRPKNPKIENLLYEIMNDDPDRHPQAVHKKILPIVPTPTKVSLAIVYSPVKVIPPPLQLPKPSAEVIAAVFPPTSEILPKPSSPSRTKGDIMGYSSDESSDDGSTGSKESIDIIEIKPPTIKLLPATVEGLSELSLIHI